MMRLRIKKPDGYAKLSSPPREAGPSSSSYSPPPTMESTTFASTTLASTTLMSTSPSTSFSTSNSHPSSPSRTNKPLPSTPTTDHRILSPPSLRTLSRCVADLCLSASLAAKVLLFIPHSRSIFTFSRKKNKNLVALKKKLLDVLAEFAKEDGEGGMDVREFDKMFSAGSEGVWSKEFMMEVARCEGRKECIEYACCALIMKNEARLREHIVKPLSHALNNKNVPLYNDLISETREILEATNSAISYWTYKLREEVKIANERLAAVPVGGENWDEDYKVFAIVKKEACEKFAKTLGVYYGRLEQGIQQTNTPDPGGYHEGSLPTAVPSSK
ncbi:hypothetical protein VTL71DRAFT_1640 [Oculimacula yallundae]|uniref:Uncharacterized protein n=1 Tax=Oculimacula yallundae TaxID=86028 RepID=A0ABR4CD71_9HELO